VLYTHFTSSIRGLKIKQVVLYDALNLQIQTIKPAHQTPLAALMFNLDGTLLATSSEKGTVIRVFDTPDGNLLYSLRRGSYTAVIYSLAFNRDSTMICASSSSGTVHIFKLDEASKRDSREQAGSVTGYLSGYMPGMVTDMMDPRSFAQVESVLVYACVCVGHFCALFEVDTTIGTRLN